MNPQVDSFDSRGKRSIQGSKWSNSSPTHECLEKAMFTLIEGKRLLDNLALQDKVFKFDPQAGCQLSCEFLIRYGILYATVLPYYR